MKSRPAYTTGGGGKQSLKWKMLSNFPFQMIFETCSRDHARTSICEGAQEGAHGLFSKKHLF